MNIEIGPQELEFLKFFKTACHQHIRCCDTSWLIGKNALNEDMSVKEKCDKIIEYNKNVVFYEMALEWLNRVMS